MLRTTIFLTILTLLFLFIGNALGGQQGMIIAFIFAIIMNFGSYWFSSKIVLSMYKAHEVQPSDYPELHNIVKNLCQRGNLPLPKLYIIDSDTPNAFATGRNPENAVVAVTTGILGILNREELTGVLAHEIAHVQHRDILIGTIAATIAGAIGMLTHIAQFALIFGRNGDNRGSNPFALLLTILIAPITATLIQLAITRTREFGADAGGAKLCGQPLWLASALEKLESSNKKRPMHRANNNPSTAHLFIVNPLTGNALTKLFSTHPPIEERIKRLKEFRS